jgi:hypothetical protein
LGHFFSLFSMKLSRIHDLGHEFGELTRFDSGHFILIDFF